MKKIILLSSVMLFSFFISVFPQENEASKNEFPELTEELTQANEVSAYSSDSIFVINSFVFNVDGITLPFMMIMRANLVKGEEITGYPGLMKYIDDKQQMLINERVLESARIEHFIGQEENGKYPVDLVIYVKDTSNLIAIPYPKYDSNSGLEIILKARDYNFFGTMNALRVDLGYKHDNQGRDFFTFMIDSGIPFEVFGLNWFFDFDHYFNYRPDYDEKFYYKNDTGLSISFPIGRTNVNIGFTESFILNEENSEGYWPIYGKFQEGFYMSSNPHISWGIPTGLEIGEYGELSYNIGFSARFNHEIPNLPLAEFRKEPSLNISHNLSFGRINWIGNFQKGISAVINNSFDYSFYNQKTGSQPLTAYYSVTGTGHFIISDFFGVSTRIIFRNWINTASGNGGDVLRGVMDNDLNIDYMLSFNLDLTFRILKFMPSEWFKNEKLRYFNFDLHLGPIIDVAFSHDPSPRPGNTYGTVYGFNNLNVTGGLEMIIFPLAFRSLYLRISVATDVYRMLMKDRGPIETFIGTDLHY